MSDWELVHTDKGDKGTTKVYQDSDGNVRIDSFLGKLEARESHGRVTLNTKNGGSFSGHDSNHENKFNIDSKTKSQ